MPAATAAKKTAPFEAFERAYTDAVAATTELREAAGALTDAERMLKLALAEDQQAERRAIVAGEDHVTVSTLAPAQRGAAEARQRLEELKGEDEARQRALAATVAQLLDGAGKEALGDVIEQLLAAGEDRLMLAVDELAAARRQLAITVGLLSATRGRAPARAHEAAALTVVAGLQSRNGDPMPWPTVERALRELPDQGRRVLEAVVAHQEAPGVRVPAEEIMRWWLAAGGDYSDSVGEIRSAYLERGPRRAEAALDEREKGDGPTGRTRDQRTWWT